MLEAMFARVESGRTAAEMNLASGLRVFLYGLAEIEPVRTLATAVRENEHTASKVLGRLISLSRLKSDPRYENPNDVALAAYLQILSNATPSIYEAALDAVRTARNCWWANEAANTARLSRASDLRSIVSGELSRTGSAISHDFVLTPPPDSLVFTVWAAAVDSEETKVYLDLSILAGC
jgi:hypothetical protein